MLSILNKIKLEIIEDIKNTQSLWDENPSNDYYHSEIYGLERALSRIKREESKELNALDEWATNEMKKEINNDTNKYTKRV